MLIFIPWRDFPVINSVKDVTSEFKSPDKISEAGNNSPANQDNINLQQTVIPSDNNKFLTQEDIEKPRQELQNNIPKLENNDKLKIDDDKVFTVVEEYPSFSGGDKARIKFLQQNIHYPTEALQNRHQGKVIINFIVEKDGSVSNLKVLDGIGKGCNDEALRVAKLMPKWNPGKQSGQPVRVSFNMPITFRLNYK